jgi:hypothetical protein
VTGYFYWPATGAKFFVPRGSQWGADLEAEGWTWVEPGCEEEIER